MIGPGKQTGKNARAAFSGALASAFSEAVARSENVRRRIVVAERIIELEFAGEALVSYVMPALEHLRCRRLDAPCSLTISLWDATSTGVQAPKSPWTAETHGARGELQHELGAGLDVWFSIISGTLQCFDREARRAYFWARDPALLTAGEQAVPLRTIAGWWADEQRWQMVHGAAVGTCHGGALLAARGGSGKSTTALACLVSGMLYAGDDTVLVSRSDAGHAIHGLYGSARIDPTELARRFADVSRDSIVVDRPGDDKASVLLYPSHAGQIARTLSLDVLVVPAISRRGETSVRRARGGEVLRALAPNSLFMVPGAGQPALDRLADIARAVPGYVLELGSSSRHNVSAIEQLIRSHGGSRHAVAFSDHHAQGESRP